MTVRVGGELELEAELSAALEAAVEGALRRGGREALDVDVVVVSDDTLSRLHGEWLGDDSRTDVIAFDLGGEDGGPQGEVYVSLDRARERAAVRGVALERELALYAVHGALHLCGLDDHDDDERARMRRAERAVMEELGYPPDDAPHELGA